MIDLKGYQHRVLDSLREFLGRCARDGEPVSAYEAVTARVYGMPQPYVGAAAGGFGKMPYVCVRVPTGGGKTLLAAHTVGIALNRFLRAPRGVALWLVPSNTILEQTAAALRDPRHFYRQALEKECAGPVEVLTIEEALRMTRALVEGATVVIVSTIQCFRTSDPEGRKVYSGDNSHMKEHVAAIPPERYAGMDMGPDQLPAPSLMNALRHRRPIVIVDEAHNARTELSFSTLAAVQPSCIIEFTATPDLKKSPSNVLHRVSAAELKAEQMVKLPLRVVTRPPGQREQLLAEAIALRKNLEGLAAREAEATGEYLRPILLIQAERVDACELLRDRLVSEYGLVRDEIRISTGKLDDLKEVKDIAAPLCPVRFIITVEKLREGWDCPFAYVLCSLRETRSATAIEQIVGRILRLPKASAKKQELLNCAYVLALAEGNRLEEVLAELKDALVGNGFTKAEAENVLLPAAQPMLPLSVQPQTVQLEPGQLDPVAFRAHADELAGKVRLDVGQDTLTVFVPLSKEDEERVRDCVSDPAAREQVTAAIERVRQIERAFAGKAEPRVATPFEQQLEFFIPLLSVAEQGRWFEFEKTHLIERPWKLSDRDAVLPPAYDPRKRPGARTGSVDVGADGKIGDAVVRERDDEDFIARLQQQLVLFERPEDWTFEELVAWLDAKIEHRDIPPGESAEFLRKAVRGLMARCGLTDVTTLALDRFRLRDELERLIDFHRNSEHKAAFQQWLLPESGLVASPDRGLDFSRTLYEPSWLYDGTFVFRKHYYGPKPGELRERTKQNELTEEFSCAQFLDGLKAVQYWVRNLAGKLSSFRLQTSTDYFYPDFVCRLRDGRVLVVEYKGTDRYDTVDSEEKRLVGAVWAQRSGGRCLFVMPQGKDFSAIESSLHQ